MQSTAAGIPAQRSARRPMFGHPLARDIAVILVVKLVLLLLGFWLFFGPQTRPNLTPDGILQHLSTATPVRAPETS